MRYSNGLIIMISRCKLNIPDHRCAFVNHCCVLIRFFILELYPCFELRLQKIQHPWFMPRLRCC